MKKLLLLLSLGLICGCHPNLTKVDDCNPDLKLVSYEEGQFRSVIKYSTTIENFDMNKVHVVAILDPSTHYKYTWRIKDKDVQEAFYKVKPEYRKLPNAQLREDNITHRSERSLKVDCADTHGVYVMVYVDKENKEK